jgi:putative phosphoesterase
MIGRPVAGLYVGTMRLVVLGDTHIPDFAKALPPGLLRALRRADLILHAGDVTASEVLDQLAGYAPVHAAMGNGDGPGVQAWGALPVVELDIDGIRVAMLHDAGPREGRERRMRRRFPQTDLVVFGHSHIPIDAEQDGLRLLNPGSPTWKRRQPAPTYATVDVEGGQIRSRIVSL